jgi:hypothetical protein
MTAPGMQWRAIESALKAFIKDATGLEAVWGFAKGTQPTRPYAVLSWLSVENVGRGASVETHNAVKNVVESHYYVPRSAQLDVNVITDELRAGGNALAYVDALCVAFDLHTMRERWLAPVGVAVADFTPARLLDAVEDGVKPVSRAVFTLRLNIAVNVEGAETPTSIQTVQLSSALTGSALTGGGSMTVSGS